MAELRQLLLQQQDENKKMMANFQQVMKGKGKGKTKGKGGELETPPEFRERYAKIDKLDQDYCMTFQFPPLGPNSQSPNGEFSHRCKNDKGEWTCMRKNCPRVHLDVPDSQRDKAMEVRRYMDDLAQYHRDAKLKKREARAAGDEARQV